MKNIFAKTLGGLILGVCLTGTLSAAGYTVSYDVKGDTRKNYVVKEIRMYYHAYADAIFEGVRAVDGSMRFTLKDIPNTGIRVRTHRNGEKISIVTMAKNAAQAKAPFAQLENDFKSKVPFYGPMVKTTDARHFLIGAFGSQSFAFLRSALGAQSGVVCAVPMITADEYGPYDDSYNVYLVMGEVLRMYNHDALPAGGIAAVTGGTTMWTSSHLNFTAILNQLLRYADHKAVEYLSFAQKKTFALQYGVQSNTGGVLTIVGRAAPNVEIASGANIRSIQRTAKYRVNDGTLLEDVFSMDARDSKGIGWSFNCTIKMQ